MGEIVGEALEQASSERVAVRRSFCSAYDALPRADRMRVETSLGGPPALFVGFASGMSPGRWRNAVQPILATLVALVRGPTAARLLEGPVPVWDIPELREFVTDMEVRRSSLGTPFFGVIEMSGLFDATRRLLEKKFAKRYVTTAPVELLAYYVAAPPPSESTRQIEILEFVRTRRSQSQFRRVWLFNCFERVVVLVHPGSLSELRIV